LIIAKHFIGFILVVILIFIMDISVATSVFVLYRYCVKTVIFETFCTKTTLTIKPFVDYMLSWYVGLYYVYQRSFWVSLASSDRKVCTKHFCRFCVCRFPNCLPARELVYAYRQVLLVYFVYFFWQTPGKSFPVT
jgi:hypothetical protein